MLKGCRGMANKKDTVGITFRCPVSVVSQLDELCSISGLKRSQFIISCIVSEYDKINGNSELKKLMDQFKLITEQVKNITGQPSLFNKSDIED